METFRSFSSMKRSTTSTMLCVEAKERPLPIAPPLAAAISGRAAKCSPLLSPSGAAMATLTTTTPPPPLLPLLFHGTTRRPAARCQPTLALVCRPGSAAAPVRFKIEERLKRRWMSGKSTKAQFASANVAEVPPWTKVSRVLIPPSVKPPSPLLPLSHHGFSHTSHHFFIIQDLRLLEGMLTMARRD
jgi:hypothetical protein